MTSINTLSRTFAHSWIYRLGLIGLVSAYVQGGLFKLADYPKALEEMAHFGLEPTSLFAPAVIALELVASAVILTGFWRMPAALALAAFTVCATIIAMPFWGMPVVHDRFTAANILAWPGAFSSSPGRTTP